MEFHTIQGHMDNNDFNRCSFCRNYCKATATCKPKEIITMDKCFWEELSTGVLIYKNNELIENFSITLTVGPHLAAPYGYWHHTNNAIGN
jgi:hypothetical protein